MREKIEKIVLGVLKILKYIGNKIFDIVIDYILLPRTLLVLILFSQPNVADNMVKNGCNAISEIPFLGAFDCENTGEPSFEARLQQAFREIREVLQETNRALQEPPYDFEVQRTTLDTAAKKLEDSISKLDAVLAEDRPSP